MSKWLLPLMVGGLGILLLSDEGLEAIQWATNKLKQAPEAFRDWNDAAQGELERIQLALDQMAESLDLAQ
jgi:hypothetical protein